MRIQDIPLTHFLTPNIPTLVRQQWKTYLYVSTSCVCPAAAVYFISNPVHAVLTVASTTSTYNQLVLPDASGLSQRGDSNYM